MFKYNILFVPDINDKKRLSELRYKVCKLVHSNQALQYPVHMSLISKGFETNNYEIFQKERKFFLQDKPETQPLQFLFSCALFLPGSHLRPVNHQDSNTFQGHHGNTPDVHITSQAQES